MAFGALVLLAVVATIIMIFTDSLPWTRIGLVAALWAALLGALLMTRYRRQAAADAAKVRDLRVVYELQLEREIAARREHEFLVEQQIRDEIRNENTEYLADLKVELAVLRQHLAELLGHSFDEERIALRAEAERIRELEDRSARLQQRAEQGAATIRETVTPEPVPTPFGAEQAAPFDETTVMPAVVTPAPDMGWEPSTPVTAETVVVPEPPAPTPTPETAVPVAPVVSDPVDVETEETPGRELDLDEFRTPPAYETPGVDEAGAEPPEGRAGAGAHIPSAETTDPGRGVPPWRPSFWEENGVTGSFAAPRGHRAPADAAPATGHPGADAGHPGADAGVSDHEVPSHQAPAPAHSHEAPPAAPATGGGSRERGEHTDGLSVAELMERLKRESGGGRRRATD